MGYTHFTRVRVRVAFASCGDSFDLKQDVALLASPLRPTSSTAAFLHPCPAVCSQVMTLRLSWHPSIGHRPRSVSLCISAYPLAASLTDVPTHDATTPFTHLAIVTQA